MQRQGQLNLACTNCHDDNWDKHLAGSAITQAHPTGYPLYRLEWQSLGSLQRRLRACMTGIRAQAYRLRRTGTGRTRALSDVARPRHADRRRRPCGRNRPHLHRGNGCDCNALRARPRLAAQRALPVSFGPIPTTTVQSEKRHDPAREFSRHQSRQIGPRTGERGGMANPRRSRRLLSPDRDVRHDRDDRQPHLLPRAGTQ